MALRLAECEQVLLIYRRTRAEMPAFEEEIEALIEESVQLQFLTAPVRIIAAGGKLTGIECIRMELGEPDQSGRRRPVPIEGSEFVIELDTLLVAIGEQVEVRFLGRGHGVELSKWGTTVVCEDTMATSVPGVFAGGDVVTGPDTVIDAMAAGKLAAEMIDKYVRGQAVERQYDFTRPSQYVPPVELTEEEADAAERPEMPSLPVADRTHSFAEVELGLTEEEAIREAKRCLRCDLQTEDGKRQLVQLAQSQAEGGSDGG